MLTVVEDEEQLSVAQDVCERFNQRLLRTLWHLQDLSHRLWNQRLPREGSELHKPCPVGVGLDEVASHLQGQSRLARAAYSGEGKKARSRQRSPYLRHLSLPADEAAPRG